jgi:hypothetical protein
MRHAKQAERIQEDAHHDDAKGAKSIGHHAEWIHAAKTGAPTTCPFSYSGPLTETAHLGNVAFRASTKIEWDAANLKIPNAPAAEAFLGRDYRPGWSLG